VSTVNSTTELLDPAEVFIWTLEDLTDVASVFVNVISDVASAADWLSIQQSSDWTNWDQTDDFTIAANTWENYQINPHSKYLRVVYTNWTTGQASFRLQTIYKSVYSTPSSHRLKDTLSWEDDAQLIKSVPVVQTNTDENYENISVQNPMPTDWDNVYQKDINVWDSTSWTFTWNIIDLFNSYTTTEALVDTSSTNPKTFTIVFQRPVTTTGLWMWSATSNFSNVKLQFTDISWTVRRTVDDSANNTKFTTNIYQFAPTSFASVIVEFHTADTVKLNGALINKDVSVVARIQALKPDGVPANVWATVDGNLKVTDAESWFAMSQWLVTWKRVLHKFWRNPDIDSGFEAIWNWGWDYTGFDATAAETIEVFSSSVADAWTEVSSWTSTGWSATTMIDTWATFVTDWVAVWDVLLLDTLADHAPIAAVTETTLTFIQTDAGNTLASWEVYRVATPASTWACAIKISEALDGDYVEQSENVILNWTTWVNTTWTFLRCARIEVLCAWSWGENAWTVTARQTTTTANIFASMPIWYNQTMIACYTVPDWKTAYMQSWFASIAKKQSAFSNVRLLIRHIWEVFQVKEEFTISSTWSSYVQRAYELSKDDMRPRTDIQIMADSDTQNNAVAAGFDLILVDN